MRMKKKGKTLIVVIVQWLRKRKTTINSVLITVFTSLLLNTISDSTETFMNHPMRVLKTIFLLDSLSGILTWGAIVLLLMINIAYCVMHKAVLKESLRDEFVEIMKNYTSDSLSEAVQSGCLSWGEGKTVLISNDIIYGWKASNVMVDNYDVNMYVFASEKEAGEYYGSKSYYPDQEGFLNYKRSEEFKHVIQRGNNLPRVMLKSCETNYDKNNRKLLLSLGRTEWSQTSYIWDWFGKKKGTEVNSNPLMNEYAMGISAGKYKEHYLPNSLCMHLIIETLDNKIIKSRISMNKNNDNPGTWAVTLGEQLAHTDFEDGNNFYHCFMLRWLKRAFEEEYKMDENLYTDIVDQDSFRVLSVDFESDRYNFALLCTVRMNYSYEVFKKKIQPLLSIDEAIELEKVEISEIPSVLSTYKDIEARKEYHPSTYLRLLVYYMHKLGFGRAQNKIVEYMLKNKAETKNDG